MEKTRVVHCKREPYTVYIGRGKCPVTGKQGKWGNPFTVAQYGRGKCIELHREWIQTQPQLLADLYELKGEVLGCWCVPYHACHGSTLAELADKS